MTAEKPCRTCGRTITWRKKWARDWDEVQYCSDACRRSRPGPTDAALERSVLELLDARARGATVCPSEAARAVGGDDWRPLMEPARAAARRLGPGAPARASTVQVLKAVGLGVLAELTAAVLMVGTWLVGLGVT